MEMSEIKFKATTFKGLEEVLAQELEDLGATSIKLSSRAVFFRGDKEFLYKANVNIRTALKIIMPLRKEKIASGDDIYNVAKRVNWEDWFDVSKNFSITTVGFSEHYNNLNYASLKVKDAIADRFFEKFNKRPDVKSKFADINVHVHIQNNLVEISLDSSGESLHRRGYRRGGHLAPLNEVLAAAMVIMSGWDKKEPLYDVMCGSGTILVEALMYANNIPPRILRDNYAFMNWENYASELYQKVVKESKVGIENNDLKLFGNDIVPKYIKIVEGQLKMLNLEGSVTLTDGDFRDTTSAISEQGVIITNPPYGERLGDNVDDLYMDLGNHVKANFKGHRMWIMSSNLSALKKTKMKPNKIYELFNGGLDVRFQEYQIR
jgi:putative N6-adenine-specific DNA methylase